MRRNKRKIIMIITLVLVLFISVGYAAINMDLDILGNITVKNQSFDVHFENVQVQKNTTNDEVPVIDLSKTKTTFTVNLTTPGDEYSFTVDIKNSGSLDAMVNTVSKTNLTEAQQKYLTYTVLYEDNSELQSKDLLSAGSTETVNVNVKYRDDISPDDLPSTTESITLNFKVNYSQADSSAKKRLTSLSDVVSENAQSSDSINFYYSAGQSGYGPDGENAKSGVYTWTENSSEIYYYRGEVDNNNVVFNNMCWLIVRTTSTGGTKLIYNGTYTEENGCNNTGEASQIGTSQFNSDYSSPADVGYMYGTRYTYSGKPMSDTYLYGNDVAWDGSKYTLIDTTTSVGSDWSTDRTTLAKDKHYTCFNTTGECTSVYYIYNFGDSDYPFYLTLKNGKNIEQAKEEMFTNTNNSTIKKTIDNWYASNLASYTEYFEDIEFCNDRSIYSGSLKNKDTNAGISSSFFGARGRLGSAGSGKVVPGLLCPNSNDKLSVSNGTLTYPVALLAADEIDLAGLGWNNPQKTNYLYTGQDWWSLSPSYLDYTPSNEVGYVCLDTSVVHNSNGVRPSLSLKSGIKPTSGTGTAQDPYRVID